MRVTSKGQVTIPIEVRKKLGLLPNTEVEFVLEGNAVRLVKGRSTQSRGRNLIEHMRGRSTVRMSTDEILKLTRG